MLAVDTLVAGYGTDAILRGVGFEVPRGTIVAVLGHNGAGKSTLVRSLIGLLPLWSGTIRLDGVDLGRLSSRRRIQAGLAVSFQDDAVFPTLSVAANLRLGGHVLVGRTERLAERTDFVLSLFPRLGERLGQAAYTLSGGERRMLSIGMALMSDPRLIILDEPSTGLSPALTDFVLATIASIRDAAGTSVILVEQNVTQALALADRAVVLKTGTVTFDGPPSALHQGAADLVMMF